MADKLKARPVSGEIMTDEPSGSSNRARDAGPRGDFVDADFETIAPVNKEIRQTSASARQTIRQAPPVQGMDSLRKADDMPRQPGIRDRGGPMFWLAGVAIAAAAFWTSGGHALVMRPAASSVQLVSPTRHLRVDNVRSRVDRAGTRVMLFVDGDVINDGVVPALLPPIQINVGTPDGGVTHYNLGTARQRIAAGGRFSFASRLKVPKNGVKSVSVTFRESGDAERSGQGN